MSPSNEQRAGLGACQKKLTNTTFSHLQPARVYDLPQILHCDRARRAHQKGAIRFSIQYIVFPTGCTEKFGLMDRRAVSQ